MKAVLITDLHFGARNDNVFFNEFFKKFYENTFFPFLKEHDIKHVFLLGDIFDRRKFVNFNTLNNCKRYFFDKLKNNNIQVYSLVGNHDIYYKNTNTVNSLNILLQEYDNIEIFSEPKEIDFFGRRILMLPWINQENYTDTLNLVNTTEAIVCFGHLEISGFEMYRGQVIDEGMDRKIFDKFDLVCSGHYHHRSSDGLIHYLGNPYEITWADYDDPRGFHVYDSKDNSLVFLENPYRIFRKVYYDDVNKNMLSFDFSSLNEKMVKVIVMNKSNVAIFEKFISRVYKATPLEVKILEDFEEFQAASVTDDLNVEDTLSLLNEYVDSVDTDKDKEKLKGILKGIYVETINREENE